MFIIARLIKYSERRKKSLNDIKGNVNLPGQAIINLYHISVFNDKNTKTES